MKIHIHEILNINVYFGVGRVRVKIEFVASSIFLLTGYSSRLLILHSKFIPPCTNTDLLYMCMEKSILFFQLLLLMISKQSSWCDLKGADEIRDLLSSILQFPRTVLSERAGMLIYQFLGMCVDARHTSRQEDDRYNIDTSGWWTFTSNQCSKYGI